MAFDDLPLRSLSALLRQESPSEVGQQLLESVGGPAWCAVEVRKDVSPELGLTLVAEQLDHHDYRRLRMAIVTALSEWLPSRHGSEAYARLARLCALLRLSAIVDAVDHQLTLGQLDMLTSEERTALLKVCIRAVGGFPTYPGTRPLLERMFEEPERFTGLGDVLFGCLVHCDHSRLGRYLARLRELRDRGTVDLSRVGGALGFEIAATCTPGEIADCFDTMAEEDRALLYFLLAGSHAPSMRVNYYGTRAPEDADIVLLDGAGEIASAVRLNTWALCWIVDHETDFGRRGLVDLSAESLAARLEESAGIGAPEGRRARSTQPARA